MEDVSFNSPKHSENKAGLTRNHWKRLWCWEGLEAGGKGDDRGWDGWMTSPTRWTWIWVNSGSWWWTGRPGVLRFMGSQRVGHNWVTELNWTEPEIFEWWCENNTRSLQWFSPLRLSPFLFFLYLFIFFFWTCDVACVWCGIKPMPPV